MRLGLIAAVAAAIFALTPTAAFGQRGTSSGADEPAAESPAAVEPAAPQSMQRRQLQRDQALQGECAGMQMQRGQRGQVQRGRMQGQQGAAPSGQRLQGMQAAAQLTERERLEQMREHMVGGMRRMATRLAAVQQRILALDRGEPDSAPPVEMGRGMRSGGGRGMPMQGQGMQMRDGSGPGCVRSQPPAGDDGDASPEGWDR